VAEKLAAQAGAGLTVIMGHTERGAVKGACDFAQLGLLAATPANINPAVNSVQGDYELMSSKNATKRGRVNSKVYYENAMEAGSDHGMVVIDVVI
jgi:carbonic anhydrase